MEGSTTQIAVEQGSINCNAEIDSSYLAQRKNSFNPHSTPRYSGDLKNNQEVIMSKVMSIVIRSTGTRQTQQPAECNYADNYYGDQVCVVRRKAR
ncbi:hypothetical protein SAMN05216562_0230 [Microbulbifer marinus]|uniref:Uncharacterized protein n=1 Tax=Microbulbifer marinus TaxID=658218 RepID=A0A1H3VUI8_9GAMM|nr:hypothetical protein SAMN05216562_0230 [Microbulbifer marinus]